MVPIHALSGTLAPVATEARPRPYGRPAHTLNTPPAARGRTTRWPDQRAEMGA